MHLDDVNRVLTNLSRMGFPILINCTRLFSFLELTGSSFIFYQNLNRTFCKQILKTMVRCHIMLCLISVCVVLHMSNIRTLGLYGLNIFD